VLVVGFARVKKEGENLPQILPPTVSVRNRFNVFYTLLYTFIGG